MNKNIKIMERFFLEILKMHFSEYNEQMYSLGGTNLHSCEGSGHNGDDMMKRLPKWCMHLCVGGWSV